MNDGLREGIPFNVDEKVKMKVDPICKQDLFRLRDRHVTHGWKKKMTKSCKLRVLVSLLYFDCEHVLLLRQLNVRFITGCLRKKYK